MGLPQWTRATFLPSLALRVLVGLFSVPGLEQIAALPLFFERAAFAAEVTAPSVEELQVEIGKRRSRVEELRFIEAEAKRLGIRAWLFGGTAAGFAHYVKWDLQREKGDPRFQKDRFDYDYTNIYRSTQDLDIVIDGTPQQANQLRNALAEKYPHLQGSKSAWEVRLLRQDMFDKQAILNNPDFMNQHTDSNSTGLIEITDPPNGESIVRDVRDWNATEPHFLKDVHEGALHYYSSPLHETTKFAREGRNPAILSVIRYLTKAFQYDLTLRPEDLAQIKQVIDRFEPKQNPGHSYVASWIEKNGKKLFQNAVNIEYAWNTLEQLGLRKKLIEFNSGDPNKSDSLAWWMNKEPLRSYEVGVDPKTRIRGQGKTARELGIDIVAHETSGFLAYESITRAHTGDSNVFISRNSAPGEAAAYGNGFYTRIGRQGARNTGFTIRFHLDPNAREGVDFIRSETLDYVIVRNKAAIRVISESLNIGPVEYFQLLSAGLEHSSDDFGILEKLNRRIGTKLRAMTPEQEKEIVKTLEQDISEIGKPKRSISPALHKWFSIDQAARFPDLLTKLEKRCDEVMRETFFREKEGIQDANQFLKDLLSFVNLERLPRIQKFFSEFEPAIVNAHSRLPAQSRHDTEFLAFIARNTSDISTARKIQEQITAVADKRIQDYRLGFLDDDGWEYLDISDLQKVNERLFVNSVVREDDPAWGTLRDKLKEKSPLFGQEAWRYELGVASPELLPKLVGYAFQEWEIQKRPAALLEYHASAHLLSGRVLPELLKAPESETTRKALSQLAATDGAQVLIEHFFPDPRSAQYEQLFVETLKKWAERQYMNQKKLSAQQIDSVADLILSQPHARNWKAALKTLYEVSDDEARKRIKERFSEFRPGLSCIYRDLLRRFGK